MSAVAPRILGSRGTPSKFVLYALKDMYAKFGAFTRLVTIFVNFDANGLDYKERSADLSYISNYVLILHIAESLCFYYSKGDSQ